MLPHNSYVSMAESKNKNFVYLSAIKDYQRQYPSELRNKYIVSKELGKVSHSNISFLKMSAWHIRNYPNHFTFSLDPFFKH